MIKKSLMNRLALVNITIAIATILNCIIHVHCDREPQPNHYDEFTIPTVLSFCSNLNYIDIAANVYMCYLWLQKQNGQHGNTQSSNEPKIPFASDLGFIHAFVASLSVILVSELGDKTFFIAAIMAMRHARLIVFAGAISALALMTILSGNVFYA